jgi:hypothetical protein
VAVGVDVVVAGDIVDEAKVRWFQGVAFGEDYAEMKHFSSIHQRAFYFYYPLGHGFTGGEFAAFRGEVDPVPHL